MRDGFDLIQSSSLQIGQRGVPEDDVRGVMMEVPRVMFRDLRKFPRRPDPSLPEFRSLIVGSGSSENKNICYGVWVVKIVFRVCPIEFGNSAATER